MHRSATWKNSAVVRRTLLTRFVTLPARVPTLHHRGTWCVQEFIYRGILITGKIELGSEYEDFVWVHRDEAVEYLDADDFLYLHQVMGGDSPTEDGKGRGRLLQEWTEAQA